MTPVQPHEMDATGTGRYSYCPKCAAPFGVAPRWGRERLVCPQCEFIFYQNPTVGVAALVLDGTRILLAMSRTAPGLWHVPAGHVEYDEDLRSAAERELLEECGLTIRATSVFEAQSNFHNPHVHVVGIWFRCEVIAGEARLGDADELAEVAYFDLDALPPLQHATDAFVLARLREELLADAAAR